MKPQTYLLNCCTLILGCATGTFFLSLLAFVVLFDLICFIATFYNRNIYEKCPESNLVNFLICWLVVPYMFLNKGKIIYIMEKVARESAEDLEVEQQKDQIKKTIGYDQLKLSNVIFYLVMFVWGLQESKIKCVSELHHNIIYWLCVIIIIFSGIMGVGILLLLCCISTTNHVRYDPSGKYKQITDEES